MGTGVGELVAVGRTAAEVAAFGAGLGGHRGADSVLDAHALALAHAPEDRHDHVVSFAAGVDAAADLGDPQLDAVVDEHGEGEVELVAVKGPVGTWLPGPALWIQHDGDIA